MMVLDEMGGEIVMKKKCFVAIILLILLPLSSFALAGQIDAITFRDIAWYSDKRTVSAKMKTIPDVSTPWIGSEQKHAKLESWFQKWEYFYSDDAIENGGVILKFNKVPIAGYSSEVELSFLYTIKNDRVTYDDDTAEFYKALYKIDGYPNMYGIYEDLRNKLKQTYGDYVSKSYYEGGLEGALWIAKDGSLIWLRVYQNSISHKYQNVMVTYFAPNGEERFASLAQQISNENTERIKEEQKKNADNFEGL